MKYFAEFCEDSLSESIGHRSCILLGPENGCTGEFCSGISVYYKVDYPEAQVHNFQEGFYVISGSGYAKIGNEEFPLSTCMSFLAPRGMLHTIRRDNSCEELVVYWFHSERNL